MSIILSIESLVNPPKGQKERRIHAGKLRRTLIRISLVAIVAAGGYVALPGGVDPAIPPSAAIREPAKAPARAEPAAGVFSGRYHEGLPVYVFPTIRVVGQRNAH